MIEKINPWINPEDMILEIKRKRQPIDYGQILGSNRLLYLGESHNEEHSIVRQHLSERTKEIALAGITHYAIEASRLDTAVYEKLLENPDNDLLGVDVGPGLDVVGYGKIIRAFAQKGVHIVPIDVEDMAGYSYQQREDVLEEELVNIYKANTSARVAVLIGSAHTYKGRLKGEFYFLGGRTEMRGIPSTTVMFAVNGNSFSKELSKAIEFAGVVQEQFMIDMRPYQNMPDIPWDLKHPDFAINLITS